MKVPFVEKYIGLKFIDFFTYLQEIFQEVSGNLLTYGILKVVHNLYFSKILFQVIKVIAKSYGLLCKGYISVVYLVRAAH